LNPPISRGGPEEGSVCQRRIRTSHPVSGAELRKFFCSHQPISQRAKTRRAQMNRRHRFGSTTVVTNGHGRDQNTSKVHGPSVPVPGGGMPEKGGEDLRTIVTKNKRRKPSPWC